MFFLGRIRSEPCTRCGLHVNDREPECWHCKDLTDLQVVYLKKAYTENIIKKNKGLAVLFCKLAAVALVISLAAFLI